MSDFDQNITALLEALKFSPDNVPLKRHLADVLRQAGHTQEAIKCLQEIMEAAPDLPTALTLAQAYYDFGKLDEAESLLKKYVRQQPLSAAAFLQMARVEFALGKFQDAGDYYQEALNLDGSLTDTKFQEELGAKGVRLKAKVAVQQLLANSMLATPPERESLKVSKLNFADVGGLDELKENIKMNIIYPFQNPQLFRSFGRKVGGGILMYGPPGCGKTFIARATAGECQASFINITITDILNYYIGESEKNLHQTFEEARRMAPTVIFIDELDALGGTRQQTQTVSFRTITNQLLTELDGVDSNNEEILVLGATNAPWFVDSALRRPGRFDRLLFVPPPDLKARIEILHVHLKERPVEEIDYVKVTRQLEKYSGADIKAVCDAAADAVIKEVLKTGKMRAIHTLDLLNATKIIKPSTLEWLATAKNYANYSNESGVYNDIVEYLKTV